MFSRRSGKKSNAFKLGAVILAPLVSMAVLEVGFRYRAHLRNNVTLEAAFSIPGAKPSSGPARFIDIIRPNPNDHVIYELRPDLDVEFKGKSLSTNSHGFRGPEYPVKAEDGTITIVGIGGSIMFGHGVADGEEFPVPLEQGLRESCPSRKWRFINTSVPSYNVVMKVETLKTKGLRFEPDLVILEVASNNLSLPNYVRVDEDPLDFGRSFILDFFRDIKARSDETEEYEAVLAHIDEGKLSWRSLVETDPSKIPARYRDLVGWDPFYKALDELAQLSEEHDFEVVVFAHLNVDLVRHMLEEARERGFHVVTLTDDVIEYLKQRNLEEVSTDGYTSSDLVVDQSNLHPSALQHQMAARRLLGDMEQLGVINRLLAR